MTDEIRQKMEDEWFARNEAELIRQARREHEARAEQLKLSQQEGEAKRLKDLHYMKCPKCGHDMSTRMIQQVEVDECGTCNGVFFDQGELDEVLLKHAAERRGFFRRLKGL